MFSSRALLVSESGLPAYDRLTVEHSGLLMERGLEAKIIQRCFTFLDTDPVAWDELCISGIEHRQSQIYRDVAIMCGLKPVVRAEKPYFFVNLEELRDRGTDYLSTLSHNTRYQLRRALREYEKCGPVKCRIAETIDEAQEFLCRLRELHQKYWLARGHTGAFSTRFANVFHDSLVRTRFPLGEIQLVEILAGWKRLGYLYNFLLGDVVSNYQSGFLYEDNAKLKPGLVAHSLAIEYNMCQGQRIYDFLMGDQRYKRSLATHEERMVWLHLQRNRLRFRIETFLRNHWQRLHG
jgi:hypothetical protein